MTKDLKPLSPKDISFISQQLRVSTIAICIFGLFFCAVLYVIFEGLPIIQGISFCIVLVGGFYIRQKVFTKFSNTIGDRLKIVLLDVPVTNKDIEMVMHLRRRRESSTTYKYFLFFEEYKIEVGSNEYDICEIGTRVHVEFTNGGHYLLHLKKAE